MKAYKSMAVAIAVLILLSAGSYAQEEKNEENKSEIDKFMEKVLDKRKNNWDQLYNYIFTEKDTFKLIGNIENPAAQAYTGEWHWRVKEGFMVRSPYKINGVEVSQEEREKAEAAWIKERKKQKENDERKEKGLAPLEDENEESDEDEAGEDSREVFFGMNTKKGSFFFAGKTVIDGLELVIVEYYPQEMIKVKDKRKKKSDDEDKQKKAEENRLKKGLNNATKVTFYIKADEHQIIQMVLSIRELDFLPARWLFHFNGIEAKMRWDKPLGDIWMPVEITANGSASMAVGKILLKYKKEFIDYRKTQVKVNFKFDPVAVEDVEKENEK